MSMTDESKQHLINYRGDLVKDLNTQEILNHLFNNEVITKTQLNDILLKPNRQSQNEALLDILPSQGQRAFEQFTIGLREICQPHLIFWEYGVPLADPKVDTVDSDASEDAAKCGAAIADPKVDTVDSHTSEGATSCTPVDVKEDTELKSTKISFYYPSNAQEFSLKQIIALLPKKQLHRDIRSCFTFGRDDESNVRLNHKSMSRWYGKIALHNTVNVSLSNCSKRKFIKVNDQNLSYNQSVMLTNNSYVKFDLITFRVCIEPGDPGALEYTIEFKPEPSVPPTPQEMHIPGIQNYAQGLPFQPYHPGMNAGFGTPYPGAPYQGLVQLPFAGLYPAPPMQQHLPQQPVSRHYHAQPCLTPVQHPASYYQQSHPALQNNLGAVNSGYVPNIPLTSSYNSDNFDKGYGLTVHPELRAASRAVPQESDERSQFHSNSNNAHY